ncbi:MAG: hypothetical protein E6J89_03190 [Deltaproteobacteria bacterium]|nr:MAG: hypothetical protein E6J89_03190 [Deltaproteobacteria bacterium]
MVFRADKYGRALRVIGQDLEELHLIAFNIKTKGKGYVIQGYAEEFERVEFQYKSEDVERVNRERQRMRSGAPRMPDFRRLSQLLRAVGSYIESKNGRLRGISKQPKSVPLFVIQYDSGKRRQEEAYPASALQDLGLRMYKRRKRVEP